MTLNVMFIWLVLLVAEDGSCEGEDLEAVAASQRAAGKDGVFPKRVNSLGSTASGLHDGAGHYPSQSRAMFF